MILIYKYFYTFSVYSYTYTFILFQHIDNNCALCEKHSMFFRTVQKLMKNQETSQDALKITPTFYFLSPKFRTIFVKSEQNLETFSEEHSQDGSEKT